MGDVFCSSFVTSLSSSLNSFQPIFPPNQRLHKGLVSFSDVPSVSDSSSSIGFRARKQLASFKQNTWKSIVSPPKTTSPVGEHIRYLPKPVQATITETEQPKWWERNAGPNMIDIHSTQEFLNALREAGDRLVIAEFYGTWCASCRALFPKLCRTAVEHPDILFLKVNFDENKPMCKNLNVKVLPYFHFYRGADGQLESFSCSLAKFQKIKDAIVLHNTARCSIGPPRGVGDLNLESLSAPKEKQAESTAT